LIQIKNFDFIKELKSVSKTKKKQLKLSNIYSVKAKCNMNQIDNLYSQGSPDLVIEFCSDFWDGKQVCEFTKSQK
jgi:hypothetical protein